MQTIFFIRMNGKYQGIPFKDVLYITGNKNYCDIITVNKKKYVAYGTIGSLEPQLPPNLFCRVHRSHIIAIDKIQSFDHNYVFIQEKELPISKEGFERLLDRIKLIGTEYANRLNDKINGLG